MLFRSNGGLCRPGAKIPGQDGRPTEADVRAINGVLAMVEPLTHRGPPRSDEHAWIDDAQEIAATWHLLLRAGIAVDAKEFHEKPWHWSAERETCRKLERFMADNGVDARKGWEMTMRAVVEAGLK